MMNDKKYKDIEKELVLKILGWSETTSPVKLSFGYVGESGQCRKGIVIENCAPKIINNLVAEGCILNLENGKIIVTIFEK